jgi:hypothetical protein
VLLLGVLVPTGWSLAALQLDPRFWKDDARSAAAVLSAEMRPGDLLFFVGNDQPWREYYWRRPPGSPQGITLQLVEPWCWQRVPFAEQVDRFEAMSREHPRTFVLLYRTKDVDPDDRWRAYLTARVGAEPRGSWPGTQLFRLAGEAR